MSILSPVDIINLKDRCEDFIGKSSVEKNDSELVLRYFSSAVHGLYADANAQFKELEKRVSNLTGEPKTDLELILEAAKKIEEAAQPILKMYREGLERKELAQTNPAEGPRVGHWLAIYLDELNKAAAINDRASVKEAMKKILYMQNVLEKRGGSAAAKLLSQLCDRRMEEIDSDHSLRNEIATRPGFLKASAETFGIISMVIGGAYVSTIVQKSISNTIQNAFGNEITQAALLSGAAMSFYRGAKRGNYLGMVLSAAALYNQGLILLYPLNLKGDQTQKN